MKLDYFYWAVIFALYAIPLGLLARWKWLRYFPIFSIFLGQNILFTLILLCFPYGSWGYFYCYCGGKGADILFGMLSIIELSRRRTDPITYTLTAYFILQMLILAVFAPMKWHLAEQLIKPLVIGFECIWIFTFLQLRRRVVSEVKRSQI
jgi:hypothetical protein